MNYNVKETIELKKGEIIMVNGVPISRKLVFSLDELLTIHAPVKSISLISRSVIGSVMEDKELVNPDLAFIQYHVVSLLEDGDEIKEFNSNWPRLEKILKGNE